MTSCSVRLFALTRDTLEFEVARPITSRHQRIESTLRYLGIEVDDALDIAERIDV